MRHRPDIDGLRAVAVIPVLLFHFGVALVSGGFTGVDIFFVISGYVISNSITADIDAGRFTIALFYDKRIRRIFPALVATLVVTTIAASIILLPGDLIDYNHSLVATSTFVSNIFFWRDSGYFGVAAQNKPLLHTWSLAVEEQFYIFAPIAYLLIARFARRRYLPFVVPVLVASFVAAVAAVFAAPTAGFFLLPTRAWELLLGAAIALWGRPAPSSRLLREGLAAIGLALIVGGLAMLTEQDPFPGWNALLPCVGAALVIQAGNGIAAVEALPLVNRLLATRPFTAIGAISYSLYLVHWPIAAFTRYLTLSPPTLWQAAVMMAASLVLATASWRFVEQPFRHRRPPRRRRTLAAGALVVAAGAAVGAAGIAARGLPGRFPGLVERPIAGLEDWGDARCFHLDPTRPIDWDAAACTRIHGRGGRILLWGDSFAAQYAPGILRNAARIDADVLQYTFAGCPPIFAYYSYARVGCSVSNARVPDIVRRERIDTVIVAGRWTETPHHTIGQLHETVAALRALGVRVVVFGQSPEFITDVQHIDYLSGNWGHGAAASWRSAIDPALNREIAAQAAGAEFVDPLARLCDGARCTYRDRSGYLYSDYGHFSRAGSVRAVAAYFPVEPSAAHR